MVNVNWSTIEVMHGDGSWVGGGLRVCRETQTGDQGLSVTICSKYIDKLDGQAMRCIEELCETLLQQELYFQERRPGLSLVY